jgi:hypothetical protein
LVQGWINDPPVTVEPFQFSPAEPVAYEWSYDRQLLNLSLSDQHAVKGIPVRTWKRTSCQCMFHGKRIKNIDNISDTRYLKSDIWKIVHLSPCQKIMGIHEWMTVKSLPNH